ncbi:hypothetical protein OUZ56_029567 [Daphnia magna]|uniref:Uncharacterized protein n=1 Tax=Daphnia magna TaxID=35525 RepID=A0ABR0B775_9CRUS|nr:hypothetical protein OUZ56_029567 [Daphnia magna]
MYARHLYFCEYLTLSRYKEVTINIHVSTRLANKQDHINALDEMDVADKLQLELLANIISRNFDKIQLKPPTQKPSPSPVLQPRFLTLFITLLALRRSPMLPVTWIVVRLYRMDRLCKESISQIAKNLESSTFSE